MAKFIAATACAAGIAGGVALTAAPGAVILPALSAVGFTAEGVAAGSCPLLP